jgi:phosphoribosyl 1,2-cyclic phosphodiesterase
MKIKFWGARGSIPISGEDCAKYGGDTTCVEIRTENNNVIIVDAGSGIRNLGKELLREKTTDITILFTHAHLDHIIGFPFFKPLYLKSTHASIRGCLYSQDAIRKILSGVMDSPYFPVNIEYLKSDITFSGECPDHFDIDTLRVSKIPLNHPNFGVGLKFAEKGKTFVFLTDNEIGFAGPSSRELAFRHENAPPYEEYVRFCAGADLLVHDAEYTPEEYSSRFTGWGHSSYTSALRLAEESKVKRFGLFHHNQDRSDDEIDRMVDDCRSIARRNNPAMECFGVAQGMEITI